MGASSKLKPSTYASHTNLISVECASRDRCSYRYGSYITKPCHFSLRFGTRLISRTFLRLGFSSLLTSLKTSCPSFRSKFYLYVCRLSSASFICFFSYQMRLFKRRLSLVSKSVLMISYLSEKISGQ